MIDEVNSQVVMHVFKKLNKGGHIPISIIHKIEKSQNVRFKKPTKRNNNRNARINEESDNNDSNEETKEQEELENDIEEDEEDESEDG